MHPQIKTQNTTIASNCEIKNGILLIDNYKFEDGKWYVLGENGSWYYLGIGANPSIELSQVDNENIALECFEKVES